MEENQQIAPLFILAVSQEKMGNAIIQLSRDDYNKELGSSLIDAKDDAEAISTFLREYRDSPETLRSYAKEIERLLLCSLVHSCHKGKCFQFKIGTIY